jgi:hypothetical protein
MTIIRRKTDELFLAATLRDESLGYRRPTVIVDDETELLLIPLPRRLIDRLRGCVRLRVTHRPHGHIAFYATASTLGRHSVREMRDLAHA